MAPPASGQGSPQPGAGPAAQQDADGAQEKQQEQQAGQAGPAREAGGGGRGAPPAPEALLPGSSEEEGDDGEGPAPAGGADGEQQQPALTAEEAARRKRRREAWEQEQERKRRWDLARRLADISTDVEFLAREVERVRGEMEVPLPPLSNLPDAERLQLEAQRRKRLADLLVNHCKKALGHITSHKWSWPFNAPVDLNQYPDYALTVTNPMDFGTVKRKIDAGPAAGGYRHPDEFLADVRLVFDNARLYNKPGSDVHVMANTLQERFEERYALAVAPRVADEAALTAVQQGEARRRHGEASGRDTEALEQHCAVLVKYIDEVSACILDARSAAAALCKPVSRQEKEALVRSLGSMPQDQFEAAVGLVMGHHPGLQAYDDFGFDLDALDALSLRQMLSFVRACEAAEYEARQRGATSLSINWPQLLLGAGLAPYKPPRHAAKRLKRPQSGAAAGQQQQQQEVAVKAEPQSQQPQAQPVHKAAPAGKPSVTMQQQPQQQQQQQQRPMAELVSDPVLPPSTLTPEEVAAAAAAAGMISPLVMGLSSVPAAGSAVAPKGLAPVVTRPAAGSAAGPARQQQQQQQQAVVGSNTQVALLGPASSAAGALAMPPPPPMPAPAPAGAAAAKPTPAQLAAVAASTPQQVQLLAQLSSVLGEVQKSQQQAAAAAVAKPAGQKN